MKRSIITLSLLLGFFTSIGQSKPTDQAVCPLALADIEAVFGKGFKEGKPSKAGDILSCRFDNKDYTIQISVNPSFGVKTNAEYNKMMSPKTVTWKAIPNDPEGAMIEIRDDAKDDLATTPAVTYMKKDKYVRLQILGNYYGFDKTKMPAARDDMRMKLARLKRIS